MVGPFRVPELIDAHRRSISMAKLGLVDVTTGSDYLSLSPSLGYHLGRVRTRESNGNIKAWKWWKGKLVRVVP
jgi:hypothetical protein